QLDQPRVQAIDSRKIESPGRHDASRKQPEFSGWQKNRERLSLAVPPPKENSDLFGALASWRFILRTDCSIDSTWSRSLWRTSAGLIRADILHSESGSQGRQIFPGSGEARTGTRKRSIAVSGQRKSVLLGSPAPCEIGSHSNTEDRIEPASRFSRSIQAKRALAHLAAQPSALARMARTQTSPKATLMPFSSDGCAENRRRKISELCASGSVTR